MKMEYFALAALAAGAPLFAGQTRTWSQGDFADFEKGVVKNLSVRSDGVLTLAPRSRELFDTSSPYLWALARDSKGNLYAGGGTGAKLYEITSSGQHKTVAELEGLEIHALAIDRRDRVYAATSPDGKVYRVSPNGKAEVFFDPKAKYIWAMLFDSSDNLLVATGDRGEIWRVTPDGNGKVFFKSDETHARSIAFDRNGNLLVGTEPSGLVIRVSPAGEGFVLYQMAKKEVTSVAVAPDGTIYAAAVGNKQPASSGGGGLLAATPPPPQIPVAPGTPAAAGARPAAVSAPPPLARTTVTGGSEVVRIEPNGNPSPIWTNAEDVVYAVALDPSGRVLLGTGNKGLIYRVESPVQYTLLLNMPATQITAFQTDRDGRIHVATGNVGKVYEIGPRWSMRARSKAKSSTPECTQRGAGSRSKPTSTTDG
jgi:sugar lactone lactonase YvrE